MRVAWSSRLYTKHIYINIGMIIDIINIKHSASIIAEHISNQQIIVQQVRRYSKIPFVCMYIRMSAKNSILSIGLSLLCQHNFMSQFSENNSRIIEHNFGIIGHYKHNH